MVLNEIIWVFGPSAIGKKTLIRNFAYGKDTRLLDIFGVDECVVVPFIPVSKGYERYRQIETIFNMSVRNDISVLTMNHIYLVHGQPIDIECSNIERLYESYPNRFNICLFLEVSESDYIIRVDLRNKFRFALNCRYIDEGGYMEAYKSFKSKYFPCINKHFKKMMYIST